MKALPLRWLALTLLAVLMVTALAPEEKTLGANARIVYLHGAWVWVAMLVFWTAAVVGFLGLTLRRGVYHRWSRALGRTGLLLWLTFLPMSLYVMQVNWNGLFLFEPRFRAPLNFAVIGLLLQVGLSFFPPAWSSLANLGYGVALFITMNGIETILHPNSPISSSNAAGIQFFFGGLVILLACAAWQITCWLHEHPTVRLDL